MLCRQRSPYLSGTMPPAAHARVYATAKACGKPLPATGKFDGSPLDLLLYLVQIMAVTDGRQNFLAEHILMPTTNVLIAGCGYIGTALGLRLAAEGYTVWGLRRRPEALPPSLHPVAADLTVPESLRALPRGIDVVFYTATAHGHTDAAYR